MAAGLCGGERRARMEWGNAKKFVIVLLVLLNIALGVLNFRQRQENTMTAAQERAIFEVLSQNGITLYTELPTLSKPMPRLLADTPSYSKETLERLFFDSKKTTVTVSTDKSVYRGDGGTLTLQGAHGLLERADVKPGKGSLTRGAAQRTAEKFISRTEFFFGTYDEPVVVERNDGFEVNFYGTYKRENVFSNYFSLLVTEGGVRRIDFSYCPVQGYDGEKRDICHADEALLTFMREWRRSGNREATISRIELGYDRMENADASVDGTVSLEPCYRIYLMEQAEPCLINAYTCQVVEKD